MHYDRTVLAYHGCDAQVANRILMGEAFRPSDNEYDWLGRGVYFWEYGLDRALKFAEFQKTQKKVVVPAVIGSVLQLGRCFDLMDTRFTSQLSEGYKLWEIYVRAHGKPIPRNKGRTPDHKLRHLDCAVLNWVLDYLEQTEGLFYDTVRCSFREGEPVYPGAGMYQESHIQIAVRNPRCILGVFRPILTEKGSKL